MNLVLLGSPGSGKGTLASFLKASFKIIHISTGDVLRQEIKDNTPLGQVAQGYIEKGQLVPDEVVIKLIESKLTQDTQSEQGYILDGFPRTKQQAQALDNILSKLDKRLDAILCLQASISVVLERLTGRRVCRQCAATFHFKYKPSERNGVCDECQGELYQRDDDNEKTITPRMDAFLENTVPMLEYYEGQGKVFKLNADKEIKEIHAYVMEKLKTDG